MRDFKSWMLEAMLPQYTFAIVSLNSLFEFENLNAQ